MLLFLWILLGLSFLIAVLLFGDSPSVRNTPLHKLHRWLVGANAKIFHYATANPTLYSALRWTVPVFYSIVIGVCIVQFFAHVYPELAIKQSVFHTVYICFSVISVVLTTELVTFSDPGYATEDSIDDAMKLYSDNGLIFFKGKTCYTCQLPKPARSKHCSVCNRCVYLYDHHCIFVNNCMGQNTYRWFIAFLLANLNVMTYGGYLCWTLLKTHKGEGGWWHTITGTSEANRIAGILLILVAIFTLIVAAFTALHFRYMYLGVTTNEADKWGDIEYLVDLGVLFYVEDLGIYVERATEKYGADGAYRVVFILLDDQTIMFLEEESHGHVMRKIDLVATDLDNAYDRGFAENLKERLIPPKQLDF